MTVYQLISRCDYPKQNRSNRMELSSLDSLMKGSERLTRELERLTKTSKNLHKPLQRVEKQLHALIRQRIDFSILERLAKDLKTLVKQHDRVTKEIERVTKEIESFVKERERLCKQLEGGRIKHYNSSQKILLVGEGDFSFSHCLARAFGFADNMVATSLDSRGSLTKNYSKAMNNLVELEARQCKIYHRVDARVMHYHPYLSFLRFDRIIYNFPHAGYINDSSSSERNTTQIRLHKKLVREFFISARILLTTNGEIHVTHKTTYPYSDWNLVKIAEDVGLYLVGEETFSLLDYPGYENKRGAGNCDQTFPVGKSSTFRFAENYLYCSATSISSFDLGA